MRFPNQIAAEGLKFGRLPGTDITLQGTGGIVCIFIIKTVNDQIQVFLPDVYMLCQSYLECFGCQSFVFLRFCLITSDLPDRIVVICSGDVIGTVQDIFSPDFFFDVFGCITVDICTG